MLETQFRRGNDVMVPQVWLVRAAPFSATELKQNQNLSIKQIPANPETKTWNYGSDMCDKTETKWVEVWDGRPKTVLELL